MCVYIERVEIYLYIFESMYTHIGFGHSGIEIYLLLNSLSNGNITTYIFFMFPLLLAMIQSTQYRKKEKSNRSGTSHATKKIHLYLRGFFCSFEYSALLCFTKIFRSVERINRCPFSFSFVWLLCSVDSIYAFFIPSIALSKELLYFSP